MALIPNPSGPGGVEDPAGLPTHCRSGHPYRPNSYRRGVDGDRDWRYCLDDEHGDDDASRWRFSSGAHEPSRIQLNTPDGEVMR